MSDNQIWIGLAIAAAFCVMAAIWYYGGFSGVSKADVGRIAPEIPMTMPTAPVH
jgi:hypothetical protein